MQYPVPQFVDRETRLLGPLTVRQLILFGITAAILFILWFLLTKFIFIIAFIVLVSTSVVLAFIKINGQPLTKVTLSMAQYFLQPRLYIWGKEEEVKTKSNGFLKMLKNIMGSSGTAPKLAKENQEEAEKEPSAEEIKNVAQILDN